MLVCLELTTGILKGKVLPVRAGETVVAGTGWAFLEGLYPPPAASPRQWAVTNNGWQADLTRFGTAPVRESGRLRHGEEFNWGSAGFRVHFHDFHAPMPPAGDGPAARLTMELAELRPLYALLDAAAMPWLIGDLHQAGVPLTSLFDGPSAAAMAGVAPYMVNAACHPHLLRHLLLVCPGARCLTLLLASVTEQDLRNHFRQFAFVRKPDGSVAYLRLHDPRIFGALLDASTPQDADALLGPIRGVITEGSTTPGDFVLRAMRGGVLDRMPLTGGVHVPTA